MKTLHLLTQTNLPETFDCALAPQDGIILLAEGVSHIYQDTVNLTDKTYVIAEDLAVRGLENSKEEIAIISYEDLPDLLFDYDRNITW